MNPLTPSSILQKASFKIAMLYEEHPNAPMFEIKSFFTGAEAEALIRTGLWERSHECLKPTEYNIFYHYIFSKYAHKAICRH